MIMTRVQKPNVDIFTIDNFLDNDTCDHLIKLIDAHAVRSTTASDVPGQYSQVVPNRTSFSSSLHENMDPIIAEVNDKMSQILNIPKEKTETLQGQRYQVGQEFKDHFDWFEGVNVRAYLEHQGNRSHTFMVYLNDDLEGGETEFEKLGIKFTPKKGMAVLWKNLNPDGSGNQLVLHAGRPVIKGSKYILTRWFREFELGKVPQEYLSKLPPLPKVENPIIVGDAMRAQLNTFSQASQLPSVHPVGFEVRKVPHQTFALIKDAYDILKNVVKPERDAEPGNNGVLQNTKNQHATELMSMDNLTTIREMILDQLQPAHEEWSKHSLIKSACYGIRSYKNDSFLKSHTDRIETHHVSSIIIVDKKCEKNWPLDIKDHQGNWHKVYAEVGDMIMYESAKLEHGRLTPFEGEYFRNLFIHYRFKDWIYTQ